MKKFFVFIALILVICSCSPKQIQRHILFECKDSSSIPYRIPALGVFQDGSLIALADYRHCRADIGFGRIDIHSRISNDNGQSWGKENVVIEGTGKKGSPDCGFGDPAVVCDRETGEVLLITVCGETVYWMQTTNRNNPNRVAILRSNDKGNTWSEWEDATEKVYSLFDECKEGCIESCFVGSGKIFQSRQIKVGDYYRIYAALCARPNGNRVIYSDDFGHTWKALGGPDAFPARDGNEPKCEELPDGSVVLSSRAEGGRIFNIYSYSDKASGEGSWGEPAFSGKNNNGTTALENACNGEILIVPARRKSDGETVSLALQSVPLGKGRANVGIWYKELPSPESRNSTSLMSPAEFAANWSGPYRISYDNSAYSTMEMQKDGRIGFFYEETENADKSGYNLVYQSIPIDSLSQDNYAAIIAEKH